MGRLEDDHYSPEDGTLVIRDAATGLGHDNSSDGNPHPVDSIVSFLRKSRANKQYKTVGALAEPTCASEDEVRATLEYAVANGLLCVGRTGDRLSLTVRARDHAC